MICFLNNSSVSQARNLEREGGGLRCPFLKIGKGCLDLDKKCPDCFHLWLKFPILNTVFRVLRKRLRNFHLRGFSLVYYLLKVCSSPITQQLQ